MSLTHTPCNHSHLSYTYPSHCVSYTTLLLHFSYPNYTYPNHITSHIFQSLSLYLLYTYTLITSCCHAHTPITSTGTHIHHTYILIISCLKHIPHATIRISYTHTHLTTVCHNYYTTIVYCPITSFLIHIPYIP